MTDKELIDFRNSILFKEIHRVERSDQFYRYLDSAELYISIAKRTKDIDQTNSVWQHNNVFEFSNPTVEDAFQYIANRILYHEKLVELIKDFDRKDVKITGVSLVQSSNDYYLGIFNERISVGKKTLKKLRPYILEHSKNYTVDRKQKSLQLDIGKFYRAWYI